MQEVPCLFCGTSGHPVAIKENGYTGRKCPTCHLIYVSPRPTQAEIQTMYQDDQVRLTAHDLIGEAYVKRLFARHHLRIIQRFIKTGSLLEIGAGAGYFLDEARKVGFNVQGIEINHSQAEFMRHTLHIACEETPLNAASFGGRQFDLIYLCNVLGHLYNPVEEFQAISDRIAQQGYLVFETGNLGDVDSKYFSLFECFDYPEHLFFFSEQNMRDMVERIGLHLVDIRRYSIQPQLMIAKFRRSIGNRLRTVRAAKPARPEHQSVPASLSGSVETVETGPGEAPNLRYLLSYLVRYPLGAWFLKEGRPQTVLVIAQKRR